jgi:UDP-N-acetylmuramoyl-L-alanyl-D-glutamate--2,6-diaminopimelate ligase
VNVGTKLRNLLEGLDARRISSSLGDAAEVEVSSVACDSRKAAAGGLFVALRGAAADGNQFVGQAIERGAIVIVSEQPSPADLPPSVAWVEVEHPRRALASLSANFYGRPAEALQLVGITGTNGKTTTSYLIDSLLCAAGHRTGLFGTIAYRTPRGEQTAKNTTPESLDLQRFLAEVRDAGGSHATLEVSSHALAMDRVWGIPFAVAVFTNLTRDHLDYHHTLDEYFAAKRRLFEGLGARPPLCGVVNADDPRAAELAGLAQRTLTYGIENNADISAKKFSLAFSGLEFTAQTPAGRVEIVSALVGRINVYNILAAVGAGLALELDREAIEVGIRNCRAVPGRFERVDEGQPFLVVVDYAHTDDALRNLIQTARELLGKSGRIITLFGCGGERDRTKRPLMGEAAGRLSDFAVLTSDNPRREDPLKIINDAVVGLQRAQANYVIEPDRARAVVIALEKAQPGDIVLLAGKGHETYQVLRDSTLDFDDREEARRVLRARGFRRSD